MDQIRLVLGVARMGERDVFGWWRAHGLSDTGGAVLPVILRRTWALAALELDVISAARRHEEALGRPTALHLFSDQLPYKRLALSWLAAQKLEASPDGLVASLRQWTSDTARAGLGAWSGDTAPTAEPVGDGLRVGSVSATDVDDLVRLDALAHELGAGYLASDGNQLRFPYVDLT